MAGVGRRTLYRKSVTDDYLNSTPEPGENEEIALAQAPRGSNIIEVSFDWLICVLFVVRRDRYRLALCCLTSPAGCLLRIYPEHDAHRPLN